jgi:hypothetical protein
MYNQYDKDPPHFSVKFGTSRTVISLGDGRGMAGTTGQPDLQTYDHQITVNGNG